jgi:sugar/nucleoside kinase (ribokinase family)
MTVADTGRRTFFHYRGANAQFAPEHCQLSSSNAKIFCLAYLLLLDQMDVPDAEYGCVAARVLADARSQGMRTVFDAVSEESDRFSKVITPALSHSDYAIINEWEAGRILGIELRPEGDIDCEAVKQAAVALINKGVHLVVIIHFPEGAVAADASGKITEQPSICIPDNYIISSLGAGDAFLAGCLFVLHNDGDIADALRAGIAVAAASLHGASATAAVNSLAHCLALYDTYPVRNW